MKNIIRLKEKLLLPILRGTGVGGLMNGPLSGFADVIQKTTEINPPTFRYFYPK